MFLDFLTVVVGKLSSCHGVADLSNLVVGEMCIPFTKEIHRTIVYKCGVELGKCFVLNRVSSVEYL